MQLGAFMNMHIYLNTEDAAVYLGIKERKLYELVAHGAVPCSKVTGKWLFPRAALDRWVEAGLAQPEGFKPASPPPIIGGSHDPLLEWAVRRSGSGLALLSEGSSAGLAKLDLNEIAMAAIHVHSSADDAEANVQAVRDTTRLTDAVVMAFARREQGLLTAAGNPLGLSSIKDVVERRARLGFRQDGAGAQLLLKALANAVALDLDTFNATGEPFATGQDLAFAIRSGEIDCGVATRAVAAANRLDFAPLTWERFDLVLRRRTYFEPGPQKLFALMRTPEFSRHAELLGGYDVTDASVVRLNR